MNPFQNIFPTAIIPEGLFNYTDHLGNIRASYTKNPQTGELEIMEENHYYPFGLKHEVYSSQTPRGFIADGELGGTMLVPLEGNEYKYKYNGKEWQDELNLNMYAMDMRMYDPAIARWVVQDPVIHFNQSPYSSFDGNPVFWADPSGADATALIQKLWDNTPEGSNTFWVNTGNEDDSSSEECCNRFKKLLEWFNGENYDGSGWGNGLRTLVKDIFGLDNKSSNIITTGILSMLQAGEVDLEGNALKKISTDPAIISYEASLVLQAMADAKFGKQAFSFKSKKSLQFGGERAAGEMWDQFKDPFNPAYIDTWKVAMNELTWLVRSTTVFTTIGVDANGKITMWHSFSDVFDLRPSPGRSDAYNKSTMILGTLYHDILGGNDKMRVNASWKKVY